MVARRPIEPAGGAPPTSRRESSGASGPEPSATATAALGKMASEEPLTLTVRGACMEPWLSDGERVAVGRRRVYWPGDVVAFRDRRGRLVVHRLLGWRPAHGGWRFLTQADAAPRADSSVPSTHLVGRVRVAVPWSQRLRAVGRLAALTAGLLGRWLARERRRGD